MKKKTLSVILALAMAASLMSACGMEKPSPEKEDTSISASVDKKDDEKTKENDTVTSDVTETDKKDDTSAETSDEKSETVKKDYESLLNKTYEYIRDFSTESDYEDEEVGLFEQIMYGCSTRNALDGVGYALKDLNGDGTDELLIMGIEKDADKATGCAAVLSIYTYVGDSIKFVDAGYSRNAIYVGSGNEILKYGSQSAAISTVGKYTLPKGESTLVSTEFYYTYAFEEDDYEIRFFKNPLGVIDAESDDKIEVSEEEFASFSSGCDDLITTVPVTAFRDYKYTGNKDYSDNGVAEVTAYWADDTMPETPDYVSMNASTDSMIMFATDKSVKDFMILSVEMVTTEEGTDITFSAFPEAYLGALTPERDFAVQLGFLGDTPNYGFSYKDMNGDYRRFLIMVSGFDGSVIAEEF